jgi:hypothetical protein
MKDIQETVEVLLAKARNAANCAEAMQFTQAALNAAHIKHALEKRAL